MANFLDEPTRGDGTSWKLTKQNFNKPPHFHDPTIEELRNHLEEQGTEESTRDSFLAKSNENVRTPAKLELLLRRPGKGLFAQKYKNGAQLCWMSGFWCGSLELEDCEGIEETYPRWSLSVLVGDFYKTGAKQIREAIITSHGDKLMGSGSGLFWKIKKDERKCLMQSLIPVGRGRSLPSVSPNRTHPNAFLKAMGFALMKIGLFYIPTTKATGSRFVILIQRSGGMLNKNKKHLSASQQSLYVSPNPFLSDLF